MSVGGSIESVSIDGREFAVAADADGTRKLGGFSNEVQPNGDGSARIIKSRMAWMLGGLTVHVDDNREDQEYLQSIADRKTTVPISVTFASGLTYSGSGTIVEEIEWSSQNTTAGISLSGGGTMTKQ